MAQQLSAQTSHLRFDAVLRRLPLDLEHEPAWLREETAALVLRFEEYLVQGVESALTAAGRARVADRTDQPAEG